MIPIAAIVVLGVLAIAYGWPAGAIGFVGYVLVFIGTAKAAEDVQRTTRLEEDPDA